MAEELGRPLITLPGPVAKESPAEEGPDRRRNPRYPFTAMAEVSELDSQTRIAGRCSDLACNGCYIDSISPFPVGSVVRVRLEREPRKFEAMGKIVYAHELMGMGIVFTSIKSEHLAVLQNWLAELSGEQLPEPETPARDPKAKIEVPANLPRVLNELINTLVRKKIISESEGATLLHHLVL